MVDLFTIPTDPVVGKYTVRSSRVTQNISRIFNDKTTKTVSNDPEIGEYQTIQDAIDAFSVEGGRVFVKNGTYVLTSSISILNKDISIEGENRDSTIIDIDSGSFHGIYNSVTFQKIFSIENITIQNIGNSKNGIHFVNSSSNQGDIHIINCKIDTGTTGSKGIYIDYISKFYLQNSEINNFSSSTGYGLHVDNHVGVANINEVISDNCYLSIYIRGGVNNNTIQVSNCLIIDCYSYGIQVVSAKYGKVINNTVKGKVSVSTSRSLIYVSTDNYGIVSNNELELDESGSTSTTTLRALYVNSSAYKPPVINNNTFYLTQTAYKNVAGSYSTYVAIYITTAYAKISNNKITYLMDQDIYSCLTVGIDLSDSDACIVDSNHIIMSNNAEDIGIRLESNTQDCNIVNNLTKNVGTSVSNAGGATNTITPNKDV